MPGHILDHEEGAVGDENVVEGAVGDDGAVQAFDHAREHGETARGGIVLIQHATGAFGPRLDGGVDGPLDVGSVEVNFRA